MPQPLVMTNPSHPVSSEVCAHTLIPLVFGSPFNDPALAPPVCPVIQSINIRPFISGTHLTANNIHSVTTAIQAIATDPYSANILSFVFNRCPEFKIFLTTETSNPYKLQVIPGARVSAGFLPELNLLLVFIDQYSPAQLIRLLRHEFQHAAEVTSVSLHVKTLDDFYPNYDERALGMPPEKVMAALENVRKDLKTVQIKLASNRVTLEAAFNRIIEPIKSSFATQKYFTFNFKSDYASSLFHVSASELRMGLTSPAPSGDGLIKIIDQHQGVSLVEFPYAIASTVGLCAMLIIQYVPDYVAPDEMYRHLAELDAHLHEALPHAVIKFMLPNFTKILERYVGVIAKPAPFYSNFDQFTLGGFQVEDVMVIPDIYLPYHILYAARKISRNPAQYKASVERTIDVLKMKLGNHRFSLAEQHEAQLYMARLYYYKAAPESNFARFTGVRGFVKDACEYYKKVFGNLKKINLPFVFHDVLKYSFCLQEMARNGSKGDLSTALNLTNQTLASFLARQKLSIPSEREFLSSRISALRQETQKLQKLS